MFKSDRNKVGTDVRKKNEQIKNLMSKHLKTEKM